MVEARGKKFEGDYIIKRQGHPIFIGHEDSRWDYNCYRVMDFIASKIREDFDEYCYKKWGKRNVSLNLTNLPLVVRPDITSELFNEELKTLVNIREIRQTYSYKISVSYKELINHQCLKGLQLFQLQEVIQKIKNFKFKTDYKIKSESNIRNTDGTPRLGFSNGISNINTNFSTIINIRETEYKLGVNNKKYNQKLEFELGPDYNASIFSIAFFHNIMSGGYQVINKPKQFYSLSKYAHILYRLRFLQFSKIRAYIKFSIIMKQLGLSTKNITNSKKKFKQIIEELSDNKLIYINEITEEVDEITYLVTTYNPKPKKKPKKKKIESKTEYDFDQLDFGTENSSNIFTMEEAFQFEGK